MMMKWSLPMITSLKSNPSNHLDIDSWLTLSEYISVSRSNLSLNCGEFGFNLKTQLENDSMSILYVCSKYNKMDEVRLDRLRSIFYTFMERDFRYTVGQKLSDLITVGSIVYDWNHYKNTGRERYLIMTNEGNVWKTVYMETVKGQEVDLIGK
jgi:hypothetical protein